jgi:Uma2 family endonuclease
MTKVGWRTGERIVELLWQLNNWNQKTRWGRVYDASMGFVAADDGSIYSPRMAWVESSRVIRLEPEPDDFLPLAPDLTIELRATAAEDLEVWRGTMERYRSLGVRLSWLINIPDRQLEIYHIDRDRAVLEFPSTVGGEDILPWFELDLTKVW